LTSFCGEPTPRRTPHGLLADCVSLLGLRGSPTCPTHLEDLKRIRRYFRGWRRGLECQRLRGRRISHLSNLYIFVEESSSPRVIITIGCPLPTKSSTQSSARPTYEVCSSTGWVTSSLPMCDHPLPLGRSATIGCAIVANLPRLIVSLSNHSILGKAARAVVDRRRR
jgi:hypothetical protein